MWDLRKISPQTTGILKQQHIGNTETRNSGKSSKESAGWKQDNNIIAHQYQLLLIYLWLHTKYLFQRYLYCTQHLCYVVVSYPLFRPSKRTTDDIMQRKCCCCTLPLLAAQWRIQHIIMFLCCLLLLCHAAFIGCCRSTSDWKQKVDWTSFISFHSISNNDVHRNKKC